MAPVLGASRAWIWIHLITAALDLAHPIEFGGGARQLLPDEQRHSVPRGARAGGCICAAKFGIVSPCSPLLPCCPCPHAPAPRGSQTREPCGGRTRAWAARHAGRGPRPAWCRRSPSAGAPSLLVAKAQVCVAWCRSGSSGLRPILVIRAIVGEIPQLGAVLARLGGHQTLLATALPLGQLSGPMRAAPPAVGTKRALV